MLTMYLTPLHQDTLPCIDFVLQNDSHTKDVSQEDWQTTRVCLLLSVSTRPQQLLHFGSLALTANDPRWVYSACEVRLAMSKIIIRLTSLQAPDRALVAALHPNLVTPSIVQDEHIHKTMGMLAFWDLSYVTDLLLPRC